VLSTRWIIATGADDVKTCTASLDEGLPCPWAWGRIGYGDPMLTPMRRQYLQIKKQYPDTIVFFRLGDFYETFDEDARIVSQVCDIVLTSRPVGKNERVPLAGVPYHAADGYIARLIHAGYKVAIVEQVGGGVSSHLRSEMSRATDASAGAGLGARGLVHREVTRVITPGTIVEPSLLEHTRNHYLAACVVETGVMGLAYADVSTGEFAATQVNSAEPWHVLGEELARLQPVEILLPGTEMAARLKESLSFTTAMTPCDAWYFDLETATETLKEQFEVATLDGFGLHGSPYAIRAAGAIIRYLSATQKDALVNFTRVVRYHPGNYMVLDAATRRNLELTQTLRGGSVKGSLLGVLDRTVTPMGARRLRQWLQQPLRDVAAIQHRLDAVEQLVHNPAIRLAVRTQLKEVGDLERLANRAAQGIIRPRELLALAQGLRAIPALHTALSELVATSQEEQPFQDALSLAFIAKAMDGCPEVVRLIEQAIAEDAPATLNSPGIIRHGFSPELDQVLRDARAAKEWVAGLEQRERQRTGIKNLKVGFNKVFGYYIEVSKSNLGAVPADYIRKQTLVNGERFITPELKEYEAMILHADERRMEIELRVYREVCAQVAAAAERLVNTARALANLDVYAALAETAVRNRYVRPEVADDLRLEISAGRHPVVEVALADDGAQLFVPNDLHMSEDERILIITGPNMSGKSTYLRQVALICLMAQIGSFVPAERAHIGIVDRIFTRIGAEDIIHAGQSTFMVEMVETANILHHATPRSLLILDEIGRGTSTYDGLSIAWAVVEYIHNHPNLRARTLFATHYHELTALADILPHVRNYNVAVSEHEGRVVFLHKIVPGGADRSYGIHVAQLAGLPRPVIRRAQEILAQLEQNKAQPVSATGSAKLREGGISHAQQVVQLSLFPCTAHPALEALRRLDVNGMTPLEALSKLYELQQLARDQ
jgi:DNA mismatch repair protein MutS